MLACMYAIRISVCMCTNIRKNTLRASSLALCAWMHECMQRVYIFTSVCLCTHRVRDTLVTYIYIYIYPMLCTHTHTYTYIHRYIHTYIYIHTHTRTHTRTHTHTHTRLRMHTYIQDINGRSCAVQTCIYARIQ
jgi:hypothetical protein